MTMEKISIVKRRKQGKVSSAIDAGAESKTSDTGRKEVSSMAPEERQTISLNLTSEQIGLVRSNDRIMSLLDETLGDAGLEIERGKEGQLILNLNFEKQHAVKMLRPDQACQMLQISRSFLMKLVKEKRIKSYKIGRLRRFSLEDILEYLTQSEEL